MRRVLSAGPAVTGLRHLIACGLDRSVFPEIDQMDLDRGEQLLQQASRFQQLSEDVFSLRLASLLTLVDDPLASLKGISRRWRLSNEETRRTGAALRHWPAILRTRTLAWSQVQPLLIDRDANTIVSLAAAIARVDQREGEPFGVDDVAAAQEALAWPQEELNPPPLLSGDDLRELGIPSGPEYSKILQAARQDQLDGKTRTRAEAIARIDRNTSS